MRSEMSSKTGSRYFKKPLDRARHQLSVISHPPVSTGEKFSVDPNPHIISNFSFVLIQ